jgi:hypothetical protein
MALTLVAYESLCMLTYAHVCSRMLTYGRLAPGMAMTLVVYENLQALIALL